MAVINFSNFDFSPEEVRSVGELVMEDILHAPDMSVLHTIWPGIVTDKFIGIIGEGGIVGIAEQGCDPEPQEWGITGEQKKWTPKRWEVTLTECWKDIEGTMAIYAMNKGVDQRDLTNTDYMAVIVEVLSAALRKMIWRFVWFADTNAKNVAAGGIITNGVDPKYFTLIDGLWKQLNAAATGTQKITIAANAAPTVADQMSQLTGQMAFDTLSAMHLQSNIVLRSQPGALFACTQSFADAYMTYLEGKGIESTYKNLTDGVNALYFRGIPVVPFPIWDELIAKYENNGTKLNNPHRCLFTTKTNIAVGTPSNGVLEDLNIWYERKERRNYIEAADAIDVKLLQEKLFTLAI